MCLTTAASHILIRSSDSDTKRWRDDGKCGAEFPLRDGKPSECDPTGISPCCNEDPERSACGNTQDYCVCDKCQDYRPINNRKCEISEVGGFLKNKCFNQQLQEHFKCARSDNDTESRYKPILETWVDSRGIFMITSTDKVCEDDPYAYQACGFGTPITIEPMLCGGGYSPDGHFNLLEEPQNSSGECDGKCDIRYTCKDESNCSGYFYGLKCHRFNELDYFPVHWICNNDAGCDEKLDEKYCELSPKNEKCTHYYAQDVLGKSITVPINNFTRCAVFDISKGTYPYCSDFLDQTNCTDTSRIGGICKKENKTISVSKSMVCYDYKNLKISLCEDGSEKFCRSLETSSNSEDDGCLVHKHKMCDNSRDCEDGRDELSDTCTLMTDSFRCRRKFGKFKENSMIPVSWLLDIEVDCINGEDEETSKWRGCFEESDRDKYVIPQNKSCQDVFICSRPSSALNTSIRLDVMCDGVESCGLENEVEKEVCRYSRDFPDIAKIAPTKGEITDVCSAIIDTRRNSCERKEFVFADKTTIFGVNKWLDIPRVRVNCDDKFGEFYVYLSCMDRCDNENVICPLGDTPTPLSYDACPGQYPDRIYTLAGEKNLTFVTKSNGKDYQNNYFQCTNRRCVEYSQVCDLTNDCGDWSDEINCMNSVLCNNNKSRISLKQQCDGIIDCVDLSDECNDNCGKRILGYWSLYLICWIMGIMATVFNIILIIRTASSYKSIKTGCMLETKILITTISVGDLLNGLYLIVIAVYDTIVYGDQYCQQQDKWLSSHTCSMLGVISTIGSQMSLFAMTALSIVRVIGLTSGPINPPSPVNKKAIFKSFLTVAIILAMSATIALIPLVPQLEDYFVQGIYYESENNVFMGFPNKERHINVLKAYFGEQLNTSYDMPWKDIHSKMGQMFTNKHETLGWRKVHFYGNDGLCLFKYFVRNDDARRSRQTLQEKTRVLDYIDFDGNALLWVVLSVNFVCFLVMFISYVRIIIQTWKSSSNSGQNSNLENVQQKERIELKISLIVATDFLCWVPFIIVCAFHNFQFIDATHWYAYFAMVVFSLNSVLNPLLYDDSITNFLALVSKRLRNYLSSFASHTQGQSPANAETLPRSMQEQETVALESRGRKNFEAENRVIATSAL